MNLVATIASHPLVWAILRIVGLALLAAGVTGLVAYVFRVRVRSSLPEGVALIIGLGVVAIVLNTRLIFVQFVGEGDDPLTVSEALLNVSVFVAAGIASFGGRYAGDRLGLSERISWGQLHPDFSPIVRATGRFITVRLPDEVTDITGYDPVDEETKAVLSGRTMDFPRGLTVEQLESQVLARLIEEHDVGYVDIELTADGTVDFLAVGKRAAGIGPTLPPKHAAVAIRSDPPFSATAGDTVQIWRTDEDGVEERVGTGELRASVESVATVTIDETVAHRIDPTVNYRLMTLAADAHPDRELAGMLRRSQETLSVLAVDAGSPLVGSPTGAIDVTIIAVRAPGGEVETIPKRTRLIAAGDTLFAIGRPDALRRLQETAGSQEPADSLTDVGVDEYLSDPGVDV